MLQSADTMPYQRLFGIIGYPLAHSFSERFFLEKFRSQGIDDAHFIPFPIEHISDLPSVIAAHPLLKGFAITIPHKKAILPMLTSATPEVQQMGACNCVRIENGQLHGYNTDVLGFEQSFRKQLLPHHTHALVLGSGGAAAAVEFGLKKLNIKYKIVSRTGDVAKGQIGYQDLTQALLSTYTVVINTTPLGTFPKVDEAPPIPYTYLTNQHYLFDLVYNPAETTFLRLGKAQGASVENGYDMLIIQAEANWAIWNGQ